MGPTITLLLTALLGAFVSAPQGSGGYDVRRADALALAEDIVQAGPLLATIWPGYWGTDESFIVAGSQQTILYKRTGNVPPGFEAVSGHPGFWAHQGTPTGLGVSSERAADLRYDTGDSEVTAVRLDESESEATELLFHEAFHVYQGTRFEVLSSPVMWSPVVAETETIAALDERELLRRALLAGDPGSVRYWAKAYVWKRLGRMAGEDDGINEAERLVERKEGSAQWVGMRMDGVLRGSSVTAIRRAFAELLSWEYTEPSIQMSADDLPMKRRQSLYATGASILELFSRLDVDTWQQRITDGASPLDILIDVLGDARLDPEDRPIQGGIYPVRCETHKDGRQPAP